MLCLRQVQGRIEFFLVHPGGPFFKHKDAGVWSVPKGLLDASDADALAAAKRELREETGFVPPEGPYVDLGTVTQASGKIVHAYAVRADFDASAIVSNEFELEWPARSGRKQRFPEVDRAAWFDRKIAGDKIIKAQEAFLDRALAKSDEIFSP